jgi:hypothetical protein
VGDRDPVEADHHRHHTPDIQNRIQQLRSQLVELEQDQVEWDFGRAWDWVDLERIWPRDLERNRKSELYSIKGWDIKMWMIDGAQGEGEGLGMRRLRRVVGWEKCVELQVSEGQM